MKFRTELNPISFPEKMEHGQKVLLVGSCFTEHMGIFLQESGFDIRQNPHGILFNPLSIRQAINDYCQHRHYQNDDLVFYKELFHSWNHHSRFSKPNTEDSLKAINNELDQGAAFLKDAQWIMITLGSAFVYYLADSDKAVANCHKFPAQTFYKKMLNPAQSAQCLNEIVDLIRVQNPSARIVFTVSPVRHAREGLIENNRSKASLLYAVHEMTEQHEHVYYFPSYELIMDDLRDYRFFMEDMVHPNRQATEYVWSYFKNAFFTKETSALADQISKLMISIRHKSFNPSTIAHKLFLEDLKMKIKQVQATYPSLSLPEEMRLFMEK